MVLHDSTYAALGLSAILDQATERLGYDWKYCTRNLGQHTTGGRQFCIRFTSGANGRSVVTSMDDHDTGLLRHERVQSYRHYPSSMAVVTESVTSITMLGCKCMVLRIHPRIRVCLGLICKVKV